MNLQNLLTTADIRSRNHHTAVKTAWTQESRIEHVRAVGGSHQDHAFIGLKSIHLHQQLVEGLLTFVVSATQACAAMTADRIDFVDKDDTRRVLLALFKQVANTRSAHTHE